MEAAKSANVLLYYRDKATQGLGRKIKAEVARVFLSNEIKDCMKVLTRINNENEGIPIDLAVIEHDNSGSLKLIDYINKRPKSLETRNCPLIPIIVVVPEEDFSLSDVREAVNAVGGANKIVPSNTPAKDVLQMVITVVANRKKVEDTFNSLKKVRVLSSKYPFMPIFGTKPAKKSKDKDNYEPGKSGSTSISALDFKMDEIEDGWDDCSHSWNGGFTKRSRAGTASTAGLALPPIDAEANDADKEHSYELDVMKEDPGEEIQRSVSADTGSLDNDDDDNKLDIAVPLSTHSHSFHARADSRAFLDEGSSANNSDHSRSTTSSMRRPPMRSKGLKMLSPAYRPWWSGSLSTDPVGKTEGSNIKYEIHSFVEKEPPTHVRPSTVGGLDKASMSRYWKQLHSHNTIGSRTTELRSSSQAELSLSSSTPRRTPTKDREQGIPAIKTSSQSAKALLMKALNVPGAGSPDKDNLSTTHSLTGSHSVTQTSEEATREFTAALKVTKQIAQIAKNTVVDSQVSQLIDIDFEHRRINQGEKDMLMRAMNLEKEGEAEAAVVCYKRAGVHSKDKQLSQMLLGNLAFRQNKFLAALGHYDLALRILHAKTVRLPFDEFLVHYNRAIVHFRIGNDSDGLKDIEKAVSIDPSNVTAREILALAKRRTGKYTQAMEEAATLKVQRSERDRMERAKLRRSGSEDFDHSVGDNSARDGSAHHMNSSMRVHFKRHSPVFIASHSQAMHSRLDVGPSVVTSPSAPNASPQKQRIFNPLFGGVQLQISQPSARNGLRELIADARQAHRGDDSNADGGGGALRTFKMNNGFELELFDNLFKKPSDLQYALVVKPTERTPGHQNVIKETLSLFPYLRNLSSSSLLELSSVVEYRALSGKEELFFQNEESGLACLLINGKVHVRMDVSFGTTMMDVVLGELENFSNFGHIDLLFRSLKPRPELLRALEESLLPHFSKQQNKIAHHETEDTEEHSVHSNEDEESDIATKLSMQLQQLWETKPLNRSIMPGMFKTYTMQSPCEILMIGEKDFSRILFDHTLEELKARIGALTSCGIFRDWEFDELIRLARMSEVKIFNRGETILKQGSKPSCLGIMMKGLSKVQKTPNRTEMLYQKLNSALEKADSHDLKYVFHHKVSKSALVPKSPSEKSSRNHHQSKHTSTFSKHGNKHSPQKKNHRQDPIEVLRAIPTVIISEPRRPTEAERVRQELQVEIEKLRHLIQKAELQDMLDNREEKDPQNHLAKSMDSTELVRSDNPAMVNNLAAHLSNKTTEVATLQWPMIFGEACLLDPENGISRGSIVADTTCEVLLLHKVQMQTFPVDADFLDRVKRKAIVYPNDPDLVVGQFRKIEWRQYKDEVMKDLDTSRWPKKFDTHEPFTI